MRVSPQGIFSIAVHEGMVPAPYLDSKNIWTVGVGHTVAAGGVDPKDLPRGNPKNVTATVQKYIQLFKHDLESYESAVNDALNVDVSQSQFDAMASFHYNTGAIGRADFVKSLNAGNLEDAGDQIMSWAKPKEIIPRRLEEQKLFETGVYPSGKITIWGVTGNNKPDFRNILGTVSYDDLMLEEPAPERRPMGFVSPPEPPEPRNSKPARAYVAPQEHVFTPLHKGDSNARVGRAQQRFTELGYHMVGPVDNDYGQMVFSATAAFQDNNGMEMTGIIDETTWDILMSPSAIGCIVSEKREDVTKEDLALKSTTAKSARQTKAGGKVVGVVGAAAVLPSLIDEISPTNISMVTRMVDSVKPLVAGVPFWMWGVLLLGAGVYFYRNGDKGEHSRWKDQVEGRHTGSDKKYTNERTGIMGALMSEIDE